MLMRVADVLSGIPTVMVLILTASLFRPSPTVLACILAGLSWPTLARIYRAQALSLRQRLHVRAAERMGAGGVYIIRRHLMPELFPLYAMGFVAKARMAMVMEASLAFLGLFDPSRKSLGMMMWCALKFYYLDIWWNWLLPPVMCLCLLVLAATFVAVAMEKAFDPRLREVL